MKTFIQALYSILCHPNNVNEKKNDNKHSKFDWKQINLLNVVFIQWMISNVSVTVFDYQRCPNPVEHVFFQPIRNWLSPDLFKRMLIFGFAWIRRRIYNNSQYAL